MPKPGHFRWWIALFLFLAASFAVILLTIKKTRPLVYVDNQLDCKENGI
jgi:hypothetical protein